MKRLCLFVVLLVAALNLVTSAQQVGQNVNVLSGTKERTGDAFLQRQNEAVVAVSTRNPDHVIVAMNDYRRVDMAFDPTPPGSNQGLIARAQPKPRPLSAEAVRAETPPEAWIGLAASRDRGRTWYTFLLPGYPQDPTAVGQASPVYGDNAGSDPVLLTGQSGRVYLIGLTFDRGGISRMSSSRWTDLNNVEGGLPFHYDFTRQIERGSMSSKGVFVDKPSAAAYAGAGGAAFATSGVSKKKKQVVVVPGCERLFVAYSRFDGNDVNGKFRSNVYTSVSADCGDSWSNPTKISGPYSVGGVNYPGIRNQGTAVAVDSDTGAVYIVWRTYDPNGFVFARSTDGGITYSSPKSLNTSPVYLFDQPLYSTLDGNNATTFRANAYPSLMVYDGKLIAVWSERVNVIGPLAGLGLPAAGGSPRTVMSVGTPYADGSVSWSPRSAIDLGDPGLATGNQRCEQEIPVPAADAVTVCRPTGAQVMPFVTGRNGEVAIVHYEARHTADAPGGIAPGTGYISGMERQLDARVALVNPDTWASVSSFQISRYAIDPATGRIKENPPLPADPEGKLKRQVSYPNYAMYRGGLNSFIGDYLHGVPLRPDGSGPGFRFVWTSNELVVPPPDLDFTKYSKPQSGVVAGCNPGSRNSTIMTTEVGTGLVVGSPGTFKQLGGVDADGNPLQRAFAVYVENHTAGFRAFRLTLAPGAGVAASFEQFASLTSVDVEVLASSSITRTVYLTGAIATGSAVVNVLEIPLLGASGTQIGADVMVPPLSASLTLNGDSTNPFVGGPGGNTDLATTEKHTPQIASPQLGTPQLGTPQIGSPQLGTPQLGTPQLGTPQLGTPQISSPQIASSAPTDPTYTDITFKVTNEGNTASAFNTLVSLATAKELNTSGHSFKVIIYRVHQTATVNGCDVGTAQQDQVVYITPQIGSPQLGTPQLGSPQIGTPQLGTPQLGSPQIGTPQLGTPQLGTPQLGTPQIASASFSIAPADPAQQTTSALRSTAVTAPTASSADGTEHQLLENDALMLTIRVFHPLGENVATAHPNLVAEFTEAAGVAVQAQAANTGQTTPESTFVDNLPPETTITASSPSPTISTTLTFSFEGFDNLTLPSDLRFECNFDSGGYAPCTSPAAYTGLAVGEHVFLVRARDQKGNVDQTPAGRTIAIVPPLQITTASLLPDAVVGIQYHQMMAASGGTGVYDWAMTAGSLPALVVFDHGIIDGMPTYRIPISTLTVRLTDPGLPGVSVSQTFTIPMPALPRNYVVTNTGDSGTGSLRQAIANANGNWGAPDTITFNIPAPPYRIAPLSALPGINEAVMIDGWSQEGPSYTGPPVVELRGNDAILTGLSVTGSGSTIRGLVINNLFGYAIAANGASNLRIEGNYVGTNVAGTARASNRQGVFIWDSTNTTIVGNLISGQGVLESLTRSDGIQISNCTGTRILDNKIGTNANADAALGNAGFGIVVDGAGNSDTAITDNVISGNPLGGISIQTGAHGTIVRSNLIGTGADTAVPIPNGRAGFVGAGGINLSNASGNTIEGNTIAHNLSEGVLGQGTSTGNLILGNSIWDNGRMGIDLWVDPGISDYGVTLNQDPEVTGRQNFPVITSAYTAGGHTNVAGTLTSRTASGFRVEVFSNDTCDPLWGHGEGAQFLGWFTVLTNTDGVGTFNEPLPPLPAGSVLTATATKTRGLGPDATSEFSQCFTVGTGPTGSGLAYPNAAAPAQTSGTPNFLLVVYSLTPGTIPPSTGITMTADLSSIGAGAAVPMVLGGSAGCNAYGDPAAYQGCGTVGAGATLGARFIPVTISDAQGRTGTAVINFTVLASGVGTVRGTVTQNGAPVVGATVSFTPAFGSDLPTFFVVTGSSGDFAAGNVRAGVWNLNASFPSLPTGPDTQVTVTAGTTVIGNIVR